jgi:hypothetical protein
MQSDPRPPLRSARLIDQLRERIRYCHYSLKTEKAYVHWARRYIRFHGLRHPREIGPDGRVVAAIRPTIWADLRCDWRALRLREFSAADESIACVVQSRSNARYLGIADGRDGAYVVDGPRLDPELILEEGNRLLAWDSAALRLFVEGYDTGVPIAIERNGHIRPLGDFWRRTRGCAATGDQHGSEAGKEYGAKRRRPLPKNCSLHEIRWGRPVCRPHVSSPRVSGP